MMRWTPVLLTLMVTVHYSIGESCSNDGQLRLTQTASVDLPNAGRVEICAAGSWGTIAASSIISPWSEKNAQVACVELGFSGALNSIFQHTVPVLDQADNSIPVHLRDVLCTGTEKSIVGCTYINSTLLQPDHSSDVYIVCRPNSIQYSDVHLGGGPQHGDVRLFGDDRNGYGAVQVYVTGRGWQGICPDIAWIDSDPSSICQDLGYTGGITTTSVFTIDVPGGQISPRRLLYDVTCPGSNDGDHFSECSFKLGNDDVSNCNLPPDLYAAVRCDYAPDRSIRLIGGSDSREGVVEIAYDGRWGVLCSEDFSIFDSRTICEELGYQREDASIVPSSPYLRAASNLRPIWLTNLMCDSSDDQLSQCVRTSNVIGYADCTDFAIAAVDCGDPPGLLNSTQIFGIVFGVMVLIFIIAPFVYVFGKDYWRRRRSYGWYRTLTSPRSWCGCCNHRGSITRSRRRNWQSPSRSNAHLTAISPMTPVSTREGPTFTFDLHRHSVEHLEPEIQRQNVQHLEPDIQQQNVDRLESAPPDSNQTNSNVKDDIAPPPSYQDSANFPTHHPNSDLPPPYPGKPQLLHPPPLAEEPPSISSPSPPATAAAAGPPTAEANLAAASAPPDVDHQGCPLPSYQSATMHSPTESRQSAAAASLNLERHGANSAADSQSQPMVSLDAASDGTGVEGGGEAGN